MAYQVNEIKEIDSLVLLIATLKEDNENNFRIHYLLKIIKAYNMIDDFQKYFGTFDKPLNFYLEQLKHAQYIVDKENELRAYNIIMTHELARKIIHHAQKKNPLQMKAIYLLKDALLHANYTVLLHLAQLDKKQNVTSIKSIDEFFLAFFCSLKKQKTYVFDVDRFSQVVGFSFFDKEQMNAFLNQNFQKQFASVNMHLLLKKFIETPIYPEKSVSPSYLERREFSGLNFFMNSTADMLRFVDELNEQDKMALDSLVDMYLNYEKYMKNATSVVK